MSKPSIPAVPRAGEDRRRFDAATKELLEILTARRAPTLPLLSEAATTAETIGKINEILARLQD